MKKLEELGIGRPSTYASIIEVLQRRNYVKIDRKRFVPEDRGRIVTAFLQTYFPRYVEYDFTAHLEEELDDISGGKIDWRQVLREFWKAFSAAVGETKDLRVTRSARQARRGARARISSRPTTMTARTRATARPAPTAGSG